MNSRIGHRALVIGAGIGGSCAAAALSPYFSEIVLLERDSLSSSIGSRVGVPQDRQPHFLLAGGLRVLDDLFPGFDVDLVGDGAVSVNVFREMHYERPDVGVLPKRDCGLKLLCATRPLIEHLLRRRVASIENVAVRPQCRVTEITPDATRRLVRFEELSGPATLDADLVVDASGRGLPTLALLDDLGWSRPVESNVGVDIGYTAFVLPEIPANHSDPKIHITLPDPSASVLAGIIMPIEGGRCFVAISAHGATERPKTWQEFLSILRRLRTPTIYDAVCDLQPVDGPRHFVFDQSRWHHFERLERLPRGVLPLGDSICRFNPVYGQGMSVAAQQAKMLRDALASVVGEVDPIGTLPMRYMTDMERLLAAPWNLGVNADFAYPGTRGHRPEHYEQSRQFESNLFRAVVADPIVQKAFANVMQLTAPLESLGETGIRRRIEALAESRSIMEIDSLGI